MNATSLRIAQYLANRAGKKMRATYPMVAKEIGWGHPTGRGLTNYLYEILHYCKDEGLPPLTTILVRKGTKYPPEDAMKYIREALGDIDLDAAQQEVFRFDWTGVFGSNDDPLTVPGLAEFDKKSGIWLTSLWGWSPSNWGCLSFTEEWMRDKFVERTDPGVIVAIYVARSGKAEADLRGHMVGFYEVTHEQGHLYNFISEERHVEHANDPERRDKWLFSLRASRAWKIDIDPLPLVEAVLPELVSQSTGRIIGARGVPVTEPDHVANLLKLPIIEVPIYGGRAEANPQSIELNRIAKVSRAVYPPKEPYFVAEADGPKHLYVMRMSCRAEEWCEAGKEIPEGASIVKVGFSKSPNSRIRQIQAAYPQGRFNWEIVHPSPIPKEAPYPDAKTAIVGEDAMKQFMADDPRRILGGEFFLATADEMQQAWRLGTDTAARVIGSV